MLAASGLKIGGGAEKHWFRFRVAMRAVRRQPHGDGMRIEMGPIRVSRLRDRLTPSGVGSWMN